MNRLEVAQTLKAYEGLAPKKLLVGQVPFVEDAEKAIAVFCTCVKMSALEKLGV